MASVRMIIVLTLMMIHHGLRTRISNTTVVKMLVICDHGPSTRIDNAKATPMVVMSDHGLNGHRTRHDVNNNCNRE